MENEISGEKLFLYFGYRPCSDTLLALGRIDQHDIEKMEYLVKTPGLAGEPTLDELRRWFSNLIKNYITFSRTKKGSEAGGVWSIHSVEEFLLHHHWHEMPNSQKRSDVWLVPVISGTKDVPVILLGNREIIADNYYGFPVKAGDTVLIHKYSTRAIIVKIMESI